MSILWRVRFQITSLSPSLKKCSGEILVKGGNLFSQYWGREDATKEAFTTDGFFKTGDCGELTVDEKALTPEDVGTHLEYYRILGRTR